MSASWLNSSTILGRRKAGLMNKRRTRSSKNRGFDYRQVAAVLRPELLALLPNRDRDELLPFDRERSPSEPVAHLRKDSTR